MWDLLFSWTIPCSKVKVSLVKCGYFAGISLQANCSLKMKMCNENCPANRTTTTFLRCSSPRLCTQAPQRQNSYWRVGYLKILVKKLCFLLPRLKGKANLSVGNVPYLTALAWLCRISLLVAAQIFPFQDIYRDFNNVPLSIQSCDWVVKLWITLYGLFDKIHKLKAFNNLIIYLHLTTSDNTMKYNNQLCTKDNPKSYKLDIFKSELSVLDLVPRWEPISREVEIKTIGRNL